MIFPTLIIKLERWKFNKEFGIYVSNLGNFKDRKKRQIPVLVGGHNCNGYCSVRTEQGLKAAHRLVLMTWKPNPQASDLTVDHLDRNKRNNALSNLEWVTMKENLKRAEIGCLNKRKPDTKLAENIDGGVIVFYVDDKLFLSIEGALAYAKKHLTSDHGSYTEEKARRILETRTINIGQICKYCGYTFRAERRPLEEVTKEVKDFNAMHYDPARMDLTSEKTKELIKEEEQKEKKVETRLSELQETEEYSFKVNSKIFEDMETAYEYATGICKKAFLANLELERVQKIYAKATITPGHVTNFCGINFSAVKKAKATCGA